MINKVDKAFFELHHDSESIYQNLQNIIENTNVTISTYQKSDRMGACQVYPDIGTVAFGSALERWGFTISTFANMYASKFNTSKEKLLTKLWGNNYYHAKNEKWTEESKDEDGNDLQRAFCSMILDPIMKLVNTVMNGEKDLYQPILQNLKIELIGHEHGLQGKDLVKVVMQKWIMASDSLLEMIILHLPSPRIAQKYRTHFLYEGPIDDDCSKAMMACDPKGPTMMFISKMIPTNDIGKFYAFGRVFSGKVAQGQKIRILGPKYKLENLEDLYEKHIQRVVLMMGNKAEDIVDVPCGNICALIGVDKCLIKQGTISDSVDACTIKSMKYSVSPIVRVAINPKNPANLPKLIEGLKNISKSDPLVQVYNTETEHIIAGSEELHL